MAQFQIYKDKAGQYRWRLRATNHQIIATSGEGYKVKGDCQKGVSLVKKHAPAAAIGPRPSTKVKATQRRQTVSR